MSTPEQSVSLEAQPYTFSFFPSHAALLVIDVQRDFVYPGGFGEMLGNKVERLQSVIEPIKKVLELFREKRLLIIFTVDELKPLPEK